MSEPSSEPSAKRQKTSVSSSLSAKNMGASSARTSVVSSDLPSSGSANTVSSRLPAMPRSAESYNFSSSPGLSEPSQSDRSSEPTTASLSPPSVQSTLPATPPVPQGPMPCNSVLTPTQKETLVEKTNPFFNAYQVTHERIVRLNDEEYAVFGNFTFAQKQDNLPFANFQNGYQLISLSTAFSTFNNLWEKWFDVVIPRVCHVFSMTDKNPKFYVTDNGQVTEGAGNTSIFNSSSKETFQPPATLDAHDVITDFKMLKTGSETNFIVYCAVKLAEKWLAVDISQMWINSSSKKLLFDYLRPKEKPGMATMANYMYTRTVRALDEYPAWHAKMYEKNTTVKFEGKFFTAMQSTDKKPPEEPWTEMFPNVYAEYAFHLPVSIEKLKFPEWTQKAYLQGATVDKEGIVYTATDATSSEPPSAHWERIHPSKGQCTGKASLISYAIIRANTQKFMGGSERPWTIALGKATWFDQRPGKYVQVSSLAAEPHWMYA